jgi:hypothetical protein
LCPAGFTGDQIERDAVARLQGAKAGRRDGRYVHEHIAAAVVSADEAKASFGKHFNTSKKHRKVPLMAASAALMVMAVTISCALKERGRKRTLSKILK